MSSRPHTGSNWVGLARAQFSSLIGMSLCLIFTTAVISDGRSATVTQSNTQHGFTVTLNKVTSTPEGVRLYVNLTNRSSDPVYFYESNTEIWVEDKKYEPVRRWDSANALPSKCLPDSQVEGVIFFPSLAPGDSSVLIRFQRPANTNNSDPWDPVEFLYPRPLSLGSTATTATGAHQSISTPRIAIIRADDMVKHTLGWDRFLNTSRELGVKVAIGIICDSLQTDHEGYYAYLCDLQQGGEVEFWIHGWDHQKLPSDGLLTVSEFRGSGYAYQKKHLSDSQTVMSKVLDRPAVALGTPWNDFDRDTLRVVHEDPALRLFFAHQTDLFDDDTAVMRILAIPTEGGTGKPSFAKFKAFYDANQSRFGDIAFQFHPSRYSVHQQSEYRRIISYLKQAGWIFMLPREYLASQNENPAYSDTEHTDSFQP